MAFATLCRRGTTSLDSSTTTDPETGEETTTYFTNMSLINVYDHTGGGNVVANGAAATALGVGTFKLTDIRDNHPYLVRRLADGSCWMVENLDLELSTSGVLTPDDSDLTENWDPYNKVAKNDWTAWALENLGQDNQPAQYLTDGQRGIWGSKYYDDPEEGKTLGDTVLDTQYSAVPRSYGNDLRRVAGTNLDGTKYDGGIDDQWNPNHASSYIGHYYNMYSATAENVQYDAGLPGPIDIQGSICPRGWLIPYADNSGTKKSGYSKTFQTYGLVHNGVARVMYEFPLSYSLTGDYSYTMGRPTSWGDRGNMMTATYRTTGGAYYIWASPTGISMLGSAVLSNGYPIRCVAHGSELNSQESQQAVATTCSAGKICYDGNGGSGSMDMQPASGTISNGASVVLTAPTYTRLGYSFAGWSTQDNGFGTVYGPNETITAPSDIATNGLRLYAKWLPASTQYTMQSFTAQACSDLGMHQTIALRDERDDNVYTVTKLKDDNCWMTSNLALNLADFAGDNPKSGYLTTANTDIGNDKDGSGNPTRTDLIDLSSTGGGNGSLYRWDPAKTMKTVAQTEYAAHPELYSEWVDSSTGITDSNYFYVASKYRLGTAQSAQFQSGDQKGPGWHWASRFNESGEILYSNSSDDTTAVNADDGIPIFHIGDLNWVESNSYAEMPRSYDNGANSFGTYYNWYAATAESGKYDAVIYRTSDSLCPKGWTLPSGKSDESGSWHDLIYNAEQLSGSDAAKLKTLPLSLVFSGYFGLSSQAPYYQNAMGRFWTSYGGTKVLARYLNITNSTVQASYNSYGKPNGNSVRCNMVINE